MWQSLFGLAVLVLLAWLLSEKRNQVSWRLPAAGLALQFLLALLLLKAPPFHAFFTALNEMILALDSATKAGASFVFGYLGGGPAPFETISPGADFVLAFRALPLILVMSALSALLFYWRILPLLVKGFAWVLQHSMNIGGALGLSAAANIFVGMVEAPLLIRPYLLKMSRSELFAMMSCGMATIAGTMMVLYGTLISGVIPDAMGHILTASMISAPAALMVARLMVPESEAATEADLEQPSSAASSMDAITQGTIDGLKLFLNIIAMLVAFVALVHLANGIISLLPEVAGEPLTLQRLLGWVMAPVVWLIGIPWQEAVTAGGLMGVKTVLNEFIAYLELAKLPAEALGERSRLIMTYALCGFANLGSLGIMIGGLTAMAPERRREFVSLGGKSIVAGTLATCMTGAVVGIVY
jgi:concentrative nucleoside transporter, CNT family